MLDENDIQLLGEMFTKQTETILGEMDRRSEVVDKRFDEVDKRFESLEKSVDSRFGEMKIYVDKRFGEMEDFVRKLIHEELLPIKEQLARLEKMETEDINAANKDIEELRKKVNYLEEQFKEIVKLGWKPV